MRKWDLLVCVSSCVCLEQQHKTANLRQEVPIDTMGKTDMIATYDERQNSPVTVY